MTSSWCMDRSGCMAQIDVLMHDIQLPVGRVGLTSSQPSSQYFCKNLRMQSQGWLHFRER